MKACHTPPPTPTIPSPRYPEPQPVSGLRTAIEEAQAERAPAAETERLTNDAVLAVEALHRWLEEIGEEEPRHEVKKALRILWNVSFKIPGKAAPSRLPSPDSAAPSAS